MSDVLRAQSIGVGGVCGHYNLAETGEAFFGMNEMLMNVRHFARNELDSNHVLPNFSSLRRTRFGTPVAFPYHSHKPTVPPPERHLSRSQLVRNPSAS